MIQQMTAVFLIPFVLERIEDGRIVCNRDCRNRPALRSPTINQFPDSDGLEPASESAALLVEPEFDNGLRNLGKDFLDDFIGILW